MGEWGQQFLFRFQRRLVKHPAGMAAFTHLALWMLLRYSQNINGEINPPALLRGGCVRHLTLPVAW